MSVNKVSYFGVTLLDLTADTVTPETLAEGVTAHNKAGDAITGTMQGGTSVPTPTAGNKPVVIDTSTGRIAKTTLTDSGLSITIPKSGQYRIRWTSFRTNTSGTWGTRVYVNGSAVGTENTSWTNSYYQNGSVDLNLNKGDVVKLYARSRSTSYYIYVGDLSASVADNGF